jgi:hypothetical protein
MLSHTIQIAGNNINAVKRDLVAVRRQYLEASTSFDEANFILFDYLILGVSDDQFQAQKEIVILLGRNKNALERLLLSLQAEMLVSAPKMGV